MARTFINGVEVVQCIHCGNIFPKNETMPVYGIEGIAAKGNWYICNDCQNNKDYGEKNVTMVHKPAKHGFRCGFEFEGIPKSDEDRAVLCSSHYNLLPTYDGSLPLGGVEYKTGIYCNLSATKQAMRTWMKHVDFSHPSCGQHINFSSENWNEWNYSYIQQHAHRIFDILLLWMRNNPEDTERVCGRYFNDYCEAEENYFSHYNWLNLSHNDRIELRIAKIKTVNQYFALVNFCKELVDLLDRNLFQYVGTGKEFRKLSQIGTKVLKLFQKYVDGNATCQRPERNSK